MAELYERVFGKSHRSSSGTYYTLDTERIYDYLFDNDYDGWFCNSSKATYENYETRKFKEFIMKLHTGESLVNGTPTWTWEQRQKLGQRYLHDLAEDMLNVNLNGNIKYDTYLKGLYDNYFNSLRLDGYEYKDRRLLSPESDVLDVQEESGVLRNLFTSLELPNQEIAFHHLQLSEEHYMNGKWDDSISNSRKFLECVLAAVAANYATKKGTPLSEASMGKPVVVRDYLEREGLLEKKEKDAVASIYALLSETGSHPYIAQSDQAKLLRHLALTFSQFVLLRLKGNRGGA